jgi:sulfur relay (sulfurtransferase) complex TusBCD TusD component (DsrE family)
MHFLITGDSWSQGEWDGYPDDYKVAHQGIQQYLIDDGHQVTNVGQGGYNNTESFDSIPAVSFDHLIFFYTDPLRQATEYEIKNILPFDIIDTHKFQLHRRLADLRNQKNCKITIIGGCAKYRGYCDNIDHVLPSISEVLVPGFEDSEYMTSREWEYHLMIHGDHLSFEQKKQWLTIMDEAPKKYNIWANNPTMFWPDGLHANRHGALAIYQHLRKLWFNEASSLD